MKEKNITKRDGRVEIYQAGKHQKYVKYAVDGLSNVSASEIEMGAAAI